jgi:two-component system, OmpR family, osmolarity sensor histidine kinase EnvZ
MLARISLIWRLALILLGALVLLQLIAIAGFYVWRGQATDAGFRFPLPDQVAALVEQLDRATPAEAKLALRAFNGAGLQASVRPDLPANDGAGRSAPGLVAELAKYLADAEPRYIAARLTGSRRSGSSGLLSRLFSPELHAVIQLRGGGYLVVETTSALYARILGLPPGFWAGIVGFLVAVLAVAAIAWQTRPLTRLARSVERFGEVLEPTPQRETGAPEMRALIRAVNGMQQRIAALVKSRSFVLGAISHDLRTYLTRLRLRAEMVGEADVRFRLVRDVEEMQALAEDALAFAEASFDDPRKEPVDLAGIVDRECAERRAGGAAIELARPSGPLLVPGNARALARAVGNLIDNAVKYGGADPVSVAVTSESSSAEVLVEDRGPGVPAGSREAIFEPFHRLEESRNRERGGAGLGLAIARQIVENHGGRIAIEDHPGGGARFRLSLPLPSKA